VRHAACLGIALSGGVAVPVLADLPVGDWVDVVTATNTTEIGRVYHIDVWDPDGAGPKTPRVVAATTRGVYQLKDGKWDYLGLPIVTALTVHDFDGDGPEPPAIVATISDVEVKAYRFDAGTNTWSPLPGVFDNIVWRLASVDPDGAGPLPPRLIAAGQFEAIDSSIVNHIATFNGTGWDQLGSGVNGIVETIFPRPSVGTRGAAPELLIAGWFTEAGGMPADHIARWDGADWAPYAPGLSEYYVDALTDWDPDGDGPMGPQLVAGGFFDTADGQTVHNVARWDGSQWHGFGDGTFGYVGALATFDPDGPGPAPAALVAGGAFDTADGVTVNRVGLWDGSAWQPLGPGVSSDAFAGVFAFMVRDLDGAGPQPESLLVGGEFTHAGAIDVNNTAAWVPAGTASPCNAADLDANGTLNLDDVILFADAFIAHEPPADLDDNAVFNLDDVILFADAFVDGCP